MGRVAYIGLPLLGGFLLAVQAPVNARLRLVLGSPVGSALISFLVGTLLLAAITLALGDGPKVAEGLGGGPWWVYVGGACGAVVVYATLVSVPKVGVLATFVAVIVGQLAFATLVDRFGWFGATIIPVTWERIAGIACFAAGLALVARSR